MTDAHTRNVERQIEWYGEPLGDRFGRLLARLGLSQAQLAGVLGLSAPMLSQLMSGHRSKISSPAVLSRLLHLEAMVGDATWDELPPDEQSRRLADVRAAERSTLTMVTPEAPPARPQQAGDPVTVIQDVLRAVASAAELEAAAHLLERDHPDLAEALRVFGTGRTPDARAYYSRLVR
ncbi:helix-turn-helix domain-containing protein [Kribbella sindirgiensis]|uniref:XRE family transcriptional regulator n=1 Tax=Kribbella sindirgiensis TaxID=1124744 RepID=A0A4R0IR57_9ACTN|nr:helix-turn-helix domain-containing protein [Kribbella sindirgiensis]TCC34874.1 XRE family transcriptional regulator [Kribbella sindirgiensis]